MKSPILICGVLLFVFIAVSVSTQSAASSIAVLAQDTDIRPETVQGDIVWEERYSSLTPPARFHHAMAYDSGRGVTVVFGGSDSSNIVLNDTWEWDGTNWTQRFPATVPPARTAHRLAYDREREVVVLFGGRNGANIFSDTWEWNGVNWVQRSPSTAPSHRWGHALAYDSAHECTVLFGGWDGNSRLNDTWEWDGTNWTQRTPSNTPPELYGHVLTYDSVRERVVLFGGWTTEAINETWEWNDINWIQRFPATSPSVRAYPALTYDSVRERVVLFGGSDSVAGGTANPTNDTWEWDGTTWTQISPSVAPTERFIHTLVYDDKRGRSVLFGGANDGRLGDTWEYGPAFILSATSIIDTITPGASAIYGISVTQGMVSSTVALDLVALPPGATAQFEPSLVLPPAQAMLTVTTSAATPLGLYPLTIAGSGGDFTNIIQVTLVVTAADFWLSSSPQEQTVYQCQSAIYTVTLDATPLFTSSVTLSLADAPSGISSSFVPPTINPGEVAMLTVATGISTATGTHGPVIFGTSDNLTRTENLSLTIQPADITLAVIPSAHTLYQGQSVSYTLDLNATPGFEWPVTLTINALPGTTSTLAPEMIWASQSATLIVTTGLSTPTGYHSLAVSGASQGLTDTTGLGLNVLPAVFTITAHPLAQALHQGQSVSYTLNLAATPDFEQPVTLTASIPPDVLSTLSPDVLWPGQSAMLAITTGLSTLAGTHLITVCGVSGGLSYTTTLTLDILPASISLTTNPTSRTAYQGQSVNYTLTLTATPELSIPVNLSTSTIPGTTSMLNSATLWPGETTVLVLTPALTTPEDIHPLLITGTGTIMSGTNHFAFTSTTQVSLTVLPADFALEVIPSAHTVFRGEVASFVIGLTSTTPGFAWPVSLSVGGIPSNTPFDFIPSEITSDTQASLLVTPTKDTPITFHQLLITGTINDLERSTEATFQMASRIFLPIVLKRWPPIPNAPTLNPIDNTDQDNLYTVAWNGAVLADIYVLEEATDALFSDAQVVYQGPNLSWITPEPGKTPSTYYYRVKARNIWGGSAWSNDQTVTIRPLFIGLELRWDGWGYVRLNSGWYDVGWHAERNALDLLDDDTIHTHVHIWYDPVPDDWTGSTDEAFESYYSLSTYRLEASTYSMNPGWKWDNAKWNNTWIMPIDWRPSSGQTIYIDDQPFSVTGPYDDYTLFGQLVRYWQLVNQTRIFYYDSGGDTTQHIRPGDAILWYAADDTRLLLYRNVLRTIYLDGNPTNETVQYVYQLTSTNAFPSE